eukprot:6525014-Pyramimonas_sp.AAC.1
MDVHDDDGVVRDSIGDGNSLDAALDDLLVVEGRQLVWSELLELHGREPGHQRSNTASAKAGLVVIAADELGDEDLVRA